MSPDPHSRPEELRAQLAARFHAPLIAFFRRKNKDRASSQDLAQEVLLRVIKAAERGEIEKPESFVFTVAINLLRDHKRQVLRDGDPNFISIDEALAAEFESQLIEELNPERVLINRDSLEDVLRTLGELNERTRDIFVLFKLENMQQQDIAALYGITRSAVEKQVMKAMLHLGVKYGKK